MDDYEHDERYKGYCVNERREKLHVVYLLPGVIWTSVPNPMGTRESASPPVFSYLKLSYFFFPRPLADLLAMKFLSSVRSELISSFTRSVLTRATMMWPTSVFTSS
jgi:hypothetical protein